jgi:HlyD family secretion protein
MMTCRSFIVGVGILLLAGGAYASLCQLQSLPQGLLAFLGRPTSQASGSPVPDRYRTGVAKRGDVSQSVSATGTLNAVVTIEVGTQLSGQLAKIYVDFNDEVKQGQALAELDRRSFDAKLAEARAATIVARTLVDVQQSKVERTRVDLRDAQARATVLHARFDNAKARSDAAENALARAMALNTRGVASAIQLEQAKTEHIVAAANFREATALTAAHVHTIQAAEAELLRAEAELAHASAGVPQRQASQLLAEIDLERTTIRSPTDGVVVGRAFSEGQTVAASLEAPTLFTIAGDLESMDIHARVDEADIGRIRDGQKATFTVDAHPGRQFEAEVTAVRKLPQQQQALSLLRRAPAPQTPSNVVTYTVVLRTSNPGTLLLPGMTAVIRIIVDEARDVLTVPMAALRYSPQGNERREPVGQPRAANVWVWDDEGKRMRPVRVEVGTMDGVRAAVASKPATDALRDGDQVIVAEAAETLPRST